MTKVTCMHYPESL